MELDSLVTYEKDISGILLGVGWIIFFFGFWLHWFLALIGFALLVAGAIVYFTPTAKARRLLGQALRAYRRKDLDAAIALAEQAEALDATSFVPKQLLALAHSDANHEEKALAYFKQIPLTRRNSYVIQRRCALSLVALDRYDEAVAILEPLFSSLEHGSYEHIEICRLLGACLHDMGQFPQAIEVLKQAPLRKQSLEYDLIPIRYLLGLCYLDMDQRGRAATQLAKVYALSPNYKDVKELLADLNE